MDIIWYQDQHFDLDLWPWDLKINKVIYSLGASTVPSLATFRQRGQKIRSWHYLFENQQFDHDLWPCEPKINREILLSCGIHCTEFGNIQAKGFKDIEQTSIGPQTDWLTGAKQYATFFQRGHNNKKTSLKTYLCKYSITPSLYIHFAIWTVGLHGFKILYLRNYTGSPLIFCLHLTLQWATQLIKQKKFENLRADLE